MDAPPQDDSARASASAPSSEPPLQPFAPERQPPIQPFAPAPPRRHIPPAAPAPRSPAAPPVAPVPPAQPGPSAPSEPKRAPPARAAWWPLILLAVPVSSLLGLAPHVKASGLGFVADVWATSVAADALFVAGTVAAVWLTAWLALKPGRPRGTRLFAAAALAFVLHYAVYFASWLLVAHQFRYDDPPASAAGQVLAGGLLGLAVMSFYGPLMALYLPRRGVGEAAVQAP